MGLFNKETLNGIFSTAKDGVQNATEKVSKTFSESSQGLKKYSEDAKKMKAPVEGAIARYGVVYNGGLKEYPKHITGEIGLNILEDCFYLKPTSGTVKNFQEMAIPYRSIKKIEIVERTISNAEWLLSSSNSDMQSMHQKNNIEITYLDNEQKSQVIRLEMLTGVSIYGQAKKCVEFMDVLRQNEILEKIMGEEKKESTTSEGDVLSQLEKLAELKDKGILSEEEFAEKKAVLLAKL